MRGTAHRGDPMTQIGTEHSSTKRMQRIYARVAGFLYLWLIITGLAGTLAISHIVGSGTFAETAERVVASEHVYRLALSSELIETLSAVLLAFALYVALKPVDKLLAQIAMYWRLGESFIGSVGMIFGYVRPASLHFPTIAGGVGNRPVTGLGGSDAPCGFRRVQHRRDIFQYRLDPLLLPVFQIEVYPQDTVCVRHICLGCGDGNVFCQSYFSRTRSDAPIRLGTDGHRRSHNRHLADVVCGKDHGATPVIDKRYSLSDVAEAIRYVEEGHARGKVVITL